MLHDHVVTRQVVLSVGLILVMFFMHVLCCVQSPGTLIATEGRWLTGSEVDAVQTLLKSEWSGNGLLPVTSDFITQIPRPFIQVKLHYLHYVQCFMVIQLWHACMFIISYYLFSHISVFFQLTVTVTEKPQLK